MIKLEAAEANPTTGIVEGQKVAVMVQGDVHYWDGTVTVTAAIENIEPGNTASGAREIAAEAGTVTITYLGMPALGEDGRRPQHGGR